MSVENLTLAEIVTARPEAAALFEKYHLDFCCKGKQKLEDAIVGSEKRKEIKDSIRSLFNQKTKWQQDFNAVSLSFLVDHILENHHTYVKENLPVIQQHLTKVAMKHGDAHPEMKKVKDLFDEIKRDFEQHMMKEEVILFPRIKQMEAAGVANFSLKDTIDVMEFEHENAGQLMEAIRQITNDFTPPSTACTTFRVVLDELKIFLVDLHQHVHLENNILFPKALDIQAHKSR